MDEVRWKIIRAAGCLFLLLGVFLFFPGQKAEATHGTFAAGDVFVSMQDGTVRWYHPNGTLNAILPTAVGGKAEGMGFDAFGNLYVTHWSPGNNIEKFNTGGLLQGAFGSGYDCNPNSIVFDAAGNAYVGQKDCNADILKFNAAGTLQDTFDAAAEIRGTGWIDLASERRQEFLLRLNPHDLHAHVLGKCRHHLIGFVQSQQTIVDEDAGQLIADSTV